MRVVVTGASGFIGRVLVQALADTGATGVAVARRTLEHLPSGWVYQSRARMLDTVPADVDAVIHLEARHHHYVIGEGSQAEDAAFTQTNVENADAWLDWAARAGIDRFVFFSSVKAIDPARAPGGPDRVDETTPGPGPSLYGRSKWQAEARVAAWVEIAPRRALILRPAVVYGPENVANIFSMVDMIARRRFFLIGAGDNVKSLVSVRNAAAASVHLLGGMKRGCEVYHLVDAERYSVRDLARIMARLLNVSEPRITLPRVLVQPLVRVAEAISHATGVSLPINNARLEAFCEHANVSPAKLQSSGFVHPETTEEGLAAMVQWYQSRGSERRHTAS